MPDARPTAVHVVLPTTSAGIFSAVMIGVGHAIGETMIVVIATGNTPIMELNIFSGMRTPAANIAVELPEALHYFNQRMNVASRGVTAAGCVAMTRGV